MLKWYEVLRNRCNFCKSYAGFEIEEIDEKNLFGKVSFRRKVCKNCGHKWNWQKIAKAVWIPERSNTLFGETKIWVSDSEESKGKLYSLKNFIKT